jgi:hypothetical protein
MVSSCRTNGQDQQTDEKVKKIRTSYVGDEKTFAPASYDGPAGLYINPDDHVKYQGYRCRARSIDILGSSEDSILHTDPNGERFVVEPLFQQNYGDDILVVCQLTIEDMIRIKSTPKGRFIIDKWEDVPQIYAFSAAYYNELVRNTGSPKHEMYRKIMDPFMEHLKKTYKSYVQIHDNDPLSDFNNFARLLGL